MINTADHRSSRTGAAILRVADPYLKDLKDTCQNPGTFVKVSFRSLERFRMIRRIGI
jgi:hypothetical protein